MGCKDCIFFKKKEWVGKSRWFRITAAVGHCMDSTNPDFSMWARMYGRGLTRFRLAVKPKWCGIGK